MFRASLTCRAFVVKGVPKRLISGVSWQRGKKLNHKLSNVLTAKIIITIVAWCIPALLFPVSLLSKLGFPAPDPIIYIRLLGMACVALVVGYWFGLVAVRRGEYPEAPVWVGIVSNGGAAIILALYGFSGYWQNWGSFAQFMMWGSLLG